MNSVTVREIARSLATLRVPTDDAGRPLAAQLRVLEAGDTGFVYRACFEWRPGIWTFVGPAFGYPREAVDFIAEINRRSGAESEVMPDPV